jgi:hypothetical protein
MAYLVYTTILLVGFHWWFQVIIYPGFVAINQQKLIQLEIRLNDFKAKSTISPSLYIGLRLLFQISTKLIETEEGYDMAALGLLRSDRSAPSSAAHDNLGQQLNRNKNHEVQGLYEEWEKIMVKACYSNFYALIIYLLPVIIFNQTKAFTSKVTTNHLNTWVNNFNYDVN